MNEELEKKIDEKLLVILNLIRTNSTGLDVVQLAQGFQYLVNGKVALEGKVTPKSKGTSAA